MVEIDRFALSRLAQVQAEILAHYEVYEFHPVVAKLQIYCSEDLGSFYLDVLKDRLYTTAPKSLARRSAQTALWQITQAMVRWMAPFLSFTAEEAWREMAKTGKVPAAHAESIFFETYLHLDAPAEALLDKWNRIRQVRDVVNKEIEALRADGKIGSSLQAAVALELPPEARNDVDSLGADLKFAFIVSSLEVANGPALKVSVKPSNDTKCDRCWHYVPGVGQHAEHPTICGRCISNLHGNGETREFV